ncbi:MAG: ZIP family metal transporter [Acidimicrobiia bacterium]
MAEAAFWGFVGASSLIVASELAFAFKFSKLVIGLIMAFGVGALISSVAFELVVPALEEVDGWVVAVSMAVGSLTFFFGDRAIANIGGSNRKNPDGNSASSESDDEGDGGLGIVLGTVLDGIPESAVLGMSLVGGGGVSVALLAGIWVSNFPESLGSTVNLLKSGWKKSKIRMMWWAIAAVSAIAAGLGFAVVNNVDAATGAVVSAFAAGALLTMIADEMAPEAYERSQIYAGLATVAGFTFALFLTSLE